MKAKLLIGLMVTALVLSISGTTQAGSFSPTGWEQEVRYHVTNYDMGTVWLNEDGTDFPDPGIYNDPRNQLTPIQATGAASATEDTWGIMRMDQILPGFVDEIHRNIEPTGDPALWNIGDSDIEVWGIFYGHEDTWIEIDANGGQNTLGTGVKAKFWAQPLGTFASVNGALGDKQFGSAQRLAEDKYAGIGYDAAGNPIPGSYVWLSGESVDGFLVDDVGNVDYSFASQFFPQGNQDGEAQVWWELWDAVNNPGEDIGTANAAWDNDPAGGEGGWYWDEIPDGVLYEADMRVQIDTKLVRDATAEFDWLVTSSDPGQMYGFAIPEPTTMLGVFLGVSSLTGYIRKRRMA